MVDILTTVAALSRQQLFFTFAVVATAATLALFVVTVRADLAAAVGACPPPRAAPSARGPRDPPRGAGARRRHAGCDAQPARAPARDPARDRGGDRRRGWAARRRRARGVDRRLDPALVAAAHTRAGAARGGADHDAALPARRRLRRRVGAARRLAGGPGGDRGRERAAAPRRPTPGGDGRAHRPRQPAALHGRARARDRPHEPDDAAGAHPRRPRRLQARQRPLRTSGR